MQTIEISGVTPGFEDKNPTLTPAKKHATRKQTVGGGASDQMTLTPNPNDELPKSSSKPSTVKKVTAKPTPIKEVTPVKNPTPAKKQPVTQSAKDKKTAVHKPGKTR